MAIHNVISASYAPPTDTLRHFRGGMVCAMYSGMNNKTDRMEDLKDAAMIVIAGLLIAALPVLAIVLSHMGSR